MSDITKCSGGKCLVKEKCKRYLSVDNQHRQSYFQLAPCKFEHNIFECEYFWNEQRGHSISYDVDFKPTWLNVDDI